MIILLDGSPRSRTSHAARHDASPSRHRRCCSRAGRAGRGCRRPRRAGEHLYGQYCVACHGIERRGRPAAEADRRGALRAQDEQTRSGRRSAASARSPPTSTSAPATCRSPQSATQPRRSRVLLSEPQIRALVAYVASLGSGPPIPTPHPERGQRLERACSSSPTTAPAATRSSRAGGYVTRRACRRRSATRPPADRRGGADRPVRDAALLAAGDLGPRSSTRSSPTSQYAKHPDDRGGWAHRPSRPRAGGARDLARRGGRARRASAS